MKPYAIVQQQPELYTITKINYRQPIKSDINVGKIRNSLPNRISNFTSIHSVPKHYQPRKSQDKQPQRLYKSIEKHQKKPIFPPPASIKPLNETQKQPSQMPQTPENNINTNEKKLDDTKEKQNNIEESKKNQDNLNKKQSIANTNLIKYKHRPIFSNNDKNDKLVQSKLLNQESPIKNLQQSNDKLNKSINKCSSHNHKPIFTKQNRQSLPVRQNIHQQLQTDNPSNRLSLFSRFGQINYKAQQKQPPQNQQENHSQAETTAKKPVYQNIEYDLSPKKLFFQQTIPKRSIYEQRKFNVISNNALTLKKTPHYSPFNIRWSYGESLYESRKKKQILRTLQENYAKFKQVVGLKQSDENSSQKSIKASQQQQPTKQPILKQLQSPKAPKIMLDKWNKVKKSSIQNRKEIDNSISQKLKTQSSSQSKISIQIIKISNIPALQI